MKYYCVLVYPLDATSKQGHLTQTAKACTALKAGCLAHDSKQSLLLTQETHICHDDQRHHCNQAWKKACCANTGLTNGAYAVDWQGSACKNTMLSARIAKSHIMWGHVMKDGWRHLSPPDVSGCNRSKGGP